MDKMKAVRELKEIIQNQKTISTKKLEHIAKFIGQEQANMGKKIEEQASTISELRKENQQQKAKLEKHNVMVEEFENLKRKHRLLKFKHAELEDVYKDLKKQVNGEGD